MTKEDILKYLEENSILPDEAINYFDDTDFILQILQVESTIMWDLPIEVQKRVLLINDKHIKNANTKKLFEDEEFANKLIEKNNDIILELKGLSIKSEYINNLIISYIKEEKEPEEGSKLEKLYDIPINVYRRAPIEIQNNAEIAKYLVEMDIEYLPYIKSEEIRNNAKEYMRKYIIERPWDFSKYKDEIKDDLTPELIEQVLKYKFENYKLIEPNHLLMKQFYDSIEKIKKIRPELNLDNPNLRYELLCDSQFINMDINIIDSLLEYNTGNVDKIIEIKNNGKLDYLIKYIEQYNTLYGNNLENIQKAISSFEKIEQLMINTNNLEGISIEDSKLKTIIASNNKFEVQNVEDLSNYEEKVKQYYANKMQNCTEIEDIIDIYSQMLFNASSKEIQSFNEEYCNYNMEELEEYANRNNVENPIDYEFKKRFELYNKLKNIQNIDELKTYFNNMPLIIHDLEETKKKISIMYSNIYNNKMLNLEDDTLETNEYQGVKVINLNGQSFNIILHRIFNFDFNMNSIANEIINDPKKWNFVEGSSTVSGTLITDKKIAALFRTLQQGNGDPLILLDTKEKEEEYQKSVIEKIRKIYEGESLEEIDESAVFYGFTEVLSDGIIKMDSTDMMVEHGKGHLETNTSNCRFRALEDLAYWTNPDYWNEVVNKRKETDLNKADELRKKKGTNRIQPTCIVCFDGHINEQSLLAAKTHNIPIVMIDRQAYLDKNKQALDKAKLEFAESLSIESMREIFYRQPYYKVALEMPNLLNIINNHKNSSIEKKKISLEYLAYLGQHFIEQSSGYIIDVPVETYNKQMKEYIQTIDLQLSEKDLVTIDDMKSAYTEISANDRKKRYEVLKKDIRDSKIVESEKLHE